jgi:hypothetical protein
MGLFGGGTKQNTASASGLSQSGLGAFAPQTNISFSKPIIDISNPMEVVALIGLLGVGVLAWRKFKKGGG